MIKLVIMSLSVIAQVVIGLSLAQAVTYFIDMVIKIFKHNDVR